MIRGTNSIRWRCKTSFVFRQLQLLRDAEHNSIRSCVKLWLMICYRVANVRKTRQMRTQRQRISTNTVHTAHIRRVFEWRDGYSGRIHVRLKWLISYFSELLRMPYFRVRRARNTEWKTTCAIYLICWFADKAVSFSNQFRYLQTWLAHRNATRTERGNSGLATCITVAERAAPPHTTQHHKIESVRRIWTDLWAIEWRTSESLASELQNDEYVNERKRLKVGGMAADWRISWLLLR